MFLAGWLSEAIITSCEQRLYHLIMHLSDGLQGLSEQGKHLSSEMLSVQGDVFSYHTIYIISKRWKVKFSKNLRRKEELEILIS